MDAVLLITTPQIRVVPGGTATVELKIVNNGTIVQGYELTVLGPAADWAEVLPAAVTTYPKTEGVASVVFRPPAGPDAPAGTSTYGIRARSMSTPPSTVVEEATVVVESEVRLTAELRPRTSRAFRRGRYHLTVRNDGNSPARVRIRPIDEAERVSLEPVPPVLQLEGGHAATSVISAQAPLNFSSAERTHNLAVEYAELEPDVPTWAPVSPAEGQRAPMESFTLTQRKVLSRPVKIAAALAVLAALLPVGKAILFKPPKVPELSSVDAASETAMNIAWTPVSGAKGYRIRAFSGKTDDAPQVGKPLDVDKELQATEWPDLVKGTLYCFRIQSEGRMSRSRLSAPTCKATDGDPVLPIPQDVKVSRTGEVTWTTEAAAATLQHVVAPAGEAGELVVTDPGVTKAQIKVPKDEKLCIDVTARDPETKMDGIASDPPMCVPTEAVVLFLAAGDGLAAKLAAAEKVFGPGSAAFAEHVKAGKVVVLKQRFDTEEEAIDFCTKTSWPKEDCEPGSEKTLKPSSG